MLPLKIIFQLSINSGIFPDQFKKTLIFPIHKNGNNREVTNYRPIAILSAIEKVFEKIVYNSLYQFISPKLSSSQHGFLKGKSTVTNLLEQTTYLFEALDQRTQVDVLFADMSKGFDKVNLLQKLSIFGVGGNLLKWIKSYLTDRPSQVVFNGSRSNTFYATSGVPQGSILGPLLFLVYIDDLTNYLSSNNSLYADDLKVKRQISDISSCNILQNDISKLHTWTSDNNLKSNPV